MTEQFEAEVNKRFTLNLLIQGAASHSFLTIHHLVRDDLNRINQKLLPHYDRVVLSVYIAQWIGDLVLFLGRPNRFWKRVAEPGQPFANHRLLTTHGKALADASWKHATARAREKGVSTVPGIQMAQSLKLVFQTFALEEGIEDELESIAKEAVSLMWNIPTDRMDAELTRTPAFGHIRTPRSLAGRLMREGAAGWSCVQQVDGRLQVVAKAWFWPLLAHELVKGTAELVCLHGLNQLADDVYDAVIETTDHIEYEVWMMQAGAELYRRWLKVIPAGLPLADALMHVSRMDPDTLEHVMLATLEQPGAATAMLSRFVA